MNEIILTQNPLSGIENPLTSPKLFALLDLIFNFLYSVGIAFFAVTLLIGGYFILTAAGDEKKVKSGRKTIIISLICLILIFLIPLIKENLFNFIRELTQ